MRSYLFAALLGCFFVSGLAQETFRFTDSSGRCWQCSPAAACVPCSSNQIDVLVQHDPNHPTTCPVPTCATVESRQILFPSPDATVFYQCSNQAGVWVSVQMTCQCGTFFDFVNQRCEFPWDWAPWCMELTNLVPIPCEETTTVPTTIMPTTTLPTTEDTTVGVVPTTAPPCNCMPWFPCWCNPCAMMPCGNCNGCQG